MGNCQGNKSGRFVVISTDSVQLDNLATGLLQLGNLGFSYAIHVQPLTPKQLIKVVAEETRADPCREHGRQRPENRLH